MYDVVVIGGGVIGGMILRELSKSDLSVCLLEKASDVCMGESKANSGIVHAGHDALPGTLKAKFNVLGNNMMPRIAEELGVKYRNNGSLVVAFSDEEIKTLKELKTRGEKNGVKGLRIIDKDELKKIEPNISENALAALFATSGGIICPYELTIAAIGNAMDNGAELLTDFEVESISGGFGGFSVVSSDGKKVEAKAVINCAGAGAQKVAEAVGDRSFRIGFRRGEYVLLDRESGDFISHTLFFTPTEKGKGLLMTQTVDNNILIGPTAEDIADNDVSTTSAGLDYVIGTAKKMCDNIPFYNVITSFAGVRAYSDRHDFIIEESKTKKGFINVVGIESPGLSASPAIAEYVVNELIGGLFELKPNKNFNPIRTPDYFFNRLSQEEKNEVIKKDKSYGHIVCRCETITEGEIRRAIRENPKAVDVDGIKRRTRAGMGRCQGGFCQPYVAEIIAEELGVPLENVTKCGKGSELLVGRTK